MCDIFTNNHLPNYRLGYYIPKSEPKPKADGKQRLKETAKQVLKIYQEDIRDHREFIGRSLARLQETEALLKKLESDLTNDKRITWDDVEKMRDKMTKMHSAGIRDDDNTHCSSSSTQNKDISPISLLIKTLDVAKGTHKPKLITNRKFVIAALSEGKKVIVSKESRSGMIIGIKNEDGKTYFIFKDNDGKYDIIDDYGDSVLEQSGEANK